MFRRCNGRVSFVAKKKKLSGREYVIYMDSSYFRTMQQNLIPIDSFHIFPELDISTPMTQPSGQVTL